MFKIRQELYSKHLELTVFKKLLVLKKLMLFVFAQAHNFVKNIVQIG